MSEVSAAFLDGGLADPARDGQAVFRAVLGAFAEPGTIRTIPPVADPPAPFPRAMGAVALALCDGETAVVIDPSFGEDAARWLTFHAGAPVVTVRGEVHFAFLSAPDLEGFFGGTDTNPHRSATIVANAAFCGPQLSLSGPGIPGGGRTVALSLPPAFLAALGTNRGLFPRGVDLLLVDGDRVIGLPRTIAVRPAVAEDVP